MKTNKYSNAYKLCDILFCKKPGIIKSAFVGLKDFIVATGANVTAALITAKIQGLF